MPFIDSKITLRLTDRQKETIKTELGQKVSLLGKPERYLMVGIADGYDLYFAGKKLERGAYVSVSLFGSASSSAYERMTKEICALFEAELGIPGDAVYVTYREVKDWGWDGSNF